MTPGASHNLSRGAPEQQKLLHAIRQLSETIGSEFFSLLVNDLHEALKAECVYIGEFVGANAQRVHLMAAAINSDGMAVSELPVADGPNSEVARGGPCVYASGVRELFPKDRFLSDLQAEAWVGLPLNGAEGETNGVIAALFREPLELELHFVQSMLNVFARRAAAELERKRRDDKLRESEERYRAFVQLSPDACWRIEFDEPIETRLPEEEQLTSIFRSGRIAECNDALVQRLGLQRIDQLVGSAITDVVLDVQNAHKCIAALIESGYRHSTVEVTAIRAGRHEHYLHSHWGIVESGRLVRVWGSSRDVSELRALEAQFRHAQRLESIGRLAAGVAHDFNNLLTVILGFSSELLSNAGSAADARTELMEIQKAAEKGSALVQQLLTLSRKSSGDGQWLDLKAIVAEDEQMLQRMLGRKIDLVIELAPSAGLIHGDSGNIHQVLLNLAANARDAMPNGGRLVISVTNVEISKDRAPHLAVVKPGPYVRLSVADNGVGMSPEVEAHLFEPFFTTKPVTQGTGLGLSTVYGIVRRSDGQIIVRTEPNKGTTFEILFPRGSSLPGLTH